MRLPLVIDPSGFPEAERSALRLDGDCFALGLSTVPTDLPVGPRLRAASLAPAVARYDLVADTWTALWVHGAITELPRPLTLAVDLCGGRRTRAVDPAPREARYAPGDLERTGGVLVTAPLRTALDLARFEDRWTPRTADLAVRVLTSDGRTLEDLRTRAAALRLVTGADRLEERLRALGAVSPR